MSVMLKMTKSNYEKKLQDYEALHLKFVETGSSDTKLYDKVIKTHGQLLKLKAEYDKVAQLVAEKQQAAEQHAGTIAGLNLDPDDKKLFKVAELVGGRTDIIAAAQNLGWLTGVKRELKRLPEVLMDGETVLMLDSGQRGNDDNASGLVVLTDKRVLMLVSRWSGDEVTDIMLPNISAVSSDGALIQKLYLTASGQKVSVRGMHQADRFAEHVRKLLSEPPQAVGGAVSAMDELRKAAELRDAGILSDTDFDALKNRLLTT